MIRQISYRTGGVIIAVATALVILSGCSNQQIYDAAQGNRALECQKYPDTRYEECMSSVDQDFDAYSAEREAAARQSQQKR